MSLELLAILKDIGGYGLSIVGGAAFVYAIFTDRLWTKSRVDELKADHKEDLDKANTLLKEANAELRVYQRYELESPPWPRRSPTSQPRTVRRRVAS